MKKWEYNVLIIDTSEHSLSYYLTIQGNVGWELIQCDRTPKSGFLYTAIFKREITI